MSRSTGGSCLTPIIASMAALELNQTSAFSCIMHKVTPLRAVDVWDRP